MKVEWADLQSGAYEVTLDDRFFMAGLVVMADSVEGYIWFVPADEHTGCLKVDPRSGDWERKLVRGQVRIYEQRPGARPC